MNKTNVLIYNSTLNRGGTEAYICGVLEELNKDKFNVEVIIKDGNKFDNVNFNRLSHACNKIHLAHGNLIKELLFIKKFCIENKNKFDVAHINATCTRVGIISYIFKKYGKIRRVIFHSHMNQNYHKIFILDQIGRSMIKKYSDIFVGCSYPANEFMFGKKIAQNKSVVLKNSVDVNLFNYDEEFRKSVRKELNIDSNTLVLLHVGRFMREKNHVFLIDAFNELLKINSNSMLILIGNGELLTEMECLVKTLNIKEKVRFLGLRDDVYRFMMASDVFVMPSIIEGLPIVCVEAQSTGLSLVLSTNIPPETKLTKHVTFLSLEETPKKWAETIISSKQSKRKAETAAIQKARFDSLSAIRVIEKLYTDKID